jgi:carboxypeptidase C (cathepsin A)
LVEILNEFKDRDDFRINIYSGDKDYICNWRGGEAWVHKALGEWYGHNYFN